MLVGVPDCPRIRLGNVAPRRRSRSRHRARERDRRRRQRLPARRRRPDRRHVDLTTSDGISIRGANQLVESGDGGDTYNYSPPTADFEVRRPEFVHVRTVESGPVRSRILIDALYQWPAAAVGDETSCTRRSDETVLTEVRTYVELRSHERFVRIRVEFDHRVRDHRLRAHFPLPDARRRLRRRVRVRRRAPWPHRRRAVPTSMGCPTFVSRRFVDCRQRRGRSRGAPRRPARVRGGRRRQGARPHAVAGHRLPLARRAVAAPQSGRSAASRRGRAAARSRSRSSTRLLPHHGDWEAADLYAAADDFLVPLEHAPARLGTGDGSAPDIGRLAPSGQALAVDGAVVSAVFRDAGGVVVRLFNPRARRGRGDRCATLMRRRTGGSSTSSALRSRASTGPSACDRPRS